MSGDRTYFKGYNTVEDRVTFRGRVRTNGGGAIDNTTRRPQFGVTIARTGVGLATATLVENDGTTAARFDEIEFAHFHTQHTEAAAAAEPIAVETLVIDETVGTITMRVLSSAGAVV